MSVSSIRFKLVVLFVSFTLSLPTEGELQQQFYHEIHKGYILESVYIKSNFSVLSHLECAQLCLKEKCSGFNYKSKKKMNEVNCQLTCIPTLADLITPGNDKSWDFYQVQDDSMHKYGTKEIPGKSCRDILTKNCGVGDGIYWISLNSSASSEFPVLCDMRNGGWTLVFKGVAGVAGYMSDIWQSPSTLNETSLNVLNIENSAKTHYKNRIVQEWSRFSPTQARVVLYSRGIEDLLLTFNAQNTNNTNWFTEANLQSSPWLDIRNITNKNYFSLIGPSGSPSKFRNFHINHHYGGCEVDTGWLSIGNTFGCAWEGRHNAPSFLYSSKTTAVKWSDYADVGVAEVFTVYLR